ncbi:FUSC family protein [Mycobacterium malmoense]|uniref:Integral membrane bound transporter domain-containing protein n=1 Tax=Mycobacterium malmoense TaxID=1780 RepID=A0ABX3SMV1_MYCMA|nr:FUSC family protein [Mycobacterium malmoense]OIN79326.1 hypothetical protein BMG05_18740 [Mycobacterium malmoense]ORA78786.1 hypothetical protein BST29_20640 [Mycobacterium malmoense]QZA20258.1 FUSC family protein [Mycobacterium malmoense]UNB97013.1 FUSC family protein [Mycobacterium malmoense]
MTVFYERARNWWIGSDPGWLRLRIATRTTAALGCSLLILDVLTRATGRPLGVTFLGVVISMIAARSVREPDPHQQRITMALLPLPAALAIAAAALLAPHKVPADVVFVMIVFAAVYIRRFGARGQALGMVAFMAYFFTLYLQARVSELPWLIGSVVVGTACTFVVTTYVLPDRPERVLRATIRSLRARMAIVVDTTADALRTGRLDDRRRRRMRTRVARLNETALMMQSQIEDQANPATPWPGISAEQLAPWLFDAELAVEWVAIAGQRAAAVEPAIPAPTRAELAAALTELAWAIRTPEPDGLRRAADRAQQVLDKQPSPTATDNPAQAAARRAALAIIAAAEATTEIRALVERAAATHEGTGAPPRASDDSGPDADAARGQPRDGLLPTTRQAIQVSVAASLAIVTGEVVSQSHWYWALIAAFVIFAGTNSWGETLTKGWQRLAGTILGVPCGVLVATLLSGHTVASLVTIFACLFCAFYFMQVTYSLMAFWITTMLALMYGLLGEFTFDVLLLRIEETAIGAVIGVTVAMLVLPTNIRPTIVSDARAFLATLSALVETSVATMFDGDDTASPIERARQLDRDLQQFRVTAKPLLAGVAGLANRRSIQLGLQLFIACDHYARNLALSAERYQDPAGTRELADAFMSAAAQTRRNIDALAAALDGEHEPTIGSVTDDLDTAEALAREQDDEPRPGTRRFLTAVHALRQIDRAVVTAATDLDLGARAGPKALSVSPTVKPSQADA